MNKILTLAVAALILMPPLAAEAAKATYTFKDTVRAGASLTVTFTGVPGNEIGLLPQNATKRDKPIANENSWDNKKGKVRLSVPKDTKPGVYELATYQPRGSSCYRGKCSYQRLAYKVIGTVTVTAKK